MLPLSPSSPTVIIQLIFSFFWTGGSCYSSNNNLSWLLVPLQQSCGRRKKPEEKCRALWFMRAIWPVLIRGIYEWDANLGNGLWALLCRGSTIVAFGGDGIDVCADWKTNKTSGLNSDAKKEKKNQLCPTHIPLFANVFFSLFDINFTHFLSCCMTPVITYSWSTEYNILQSLPWAFALIPSDCCPHSGGDWSFPAAGGISASCLVQFDAETHRWECHHCVFHLHFWLKKTDAAANPRAVIYVPGLFCSGQRLWRRRGSSLLASAQSDVSLLRIVIIFNCWPYLLAPPPNVTCLPERGGSDAALHGAS